MEKLRIGIVKLRPAAQVPRFAHGPDEDAGMDLTAVEEVTLRPGSWASVATGFAIAIPAGYEGQVRPRSGLAQKFGVTLLNSPGTIDPGYRGEVRVLMINHGSGDYTVRQGDRIAQLVVAPYSPVEWVVEEELPATDRGPSGFGSTGA